MIRSKPPWGEGKSLQERGAQQVQRSCGRNLLGVLLAIAETLVGL